MPLKAHKIRAEAACNERSWPNLQNKNQGNQPLQTFIEPAGLPQLPPCQVIQRGPGCTRTPPMRRGPHRKTFDNAAIHVISSDGRFSAVFDTDAVEAVLAHLRGAQP
ncbi:hypothetical protein [Leisingera aquimarina]|uniref:hypothetical protein n=1 Tax=Leisingera aquimarina TaxID=476529 RepID=UPI001FE1236C|nr:hypothetical protein [Leisingera aquimarina]